MYDVPHTSILVNLVANFSSNLKSNVNLNDIRLYFYIQSDEPISNSASDSINFRVTCIDKSSVVTLLLTTDSSQSKVSFYEKVYVQL